MKHPSAFAGLFGFACVALAASVWRDLAGPAFLGIAALVCAVVTLSIETRKAVKESRILLMEDSLEKLKGTAAALLKVEARTSAVERSLAHQMREDI